MELKTMLSLKRDILSIVNVSFKYAFACYTMLYILMHKLDITYFSGFTGFAGILFF